MNTSFFSLKLKWNVQQYGCVTKYITSLAPTQRVWGSYQFVNNGTTDDGPIPAGIGIGNQSTDEWRQATHPTKVGECVRGFNQRQVQLLGQVCYHVGMETSCSKLVAYFICCIKIGRRKKEEERINVIITHQFSINLYSTWLIIFLRIPLCHGL